jgi:hypothetical protein
MPVEVHSEGLKRRYVASWLSFACCLNLLLLAGAAILPLYIIYTTRMWLVQVVRHEQLVLQYQNSLVIQLQGLRGPSTGYRAPFTAMWSTSPAANDLLGNGVVRGMVLRSSFQDLNSDGLGDVFKLSVTMPLQPDETIHGATVVAFMSAAFTVRCPPACLHTAHPLLSRPRLPRTPRVLLCPPPPTRTPPPLPYLTPPTPHPPHFTQNAASLQMDAVLSHSFFSGVPGQRLVLDGDVTLQQRCALPRMGGAPYQPYLFTPIPALSAAQSAYAASPEGILAGVSGRNFTLRFTPAVAPVWVPDATIPGPLAATASALATQARSFQLSLTARVPLGPLLVTPSIPEELKWGWVQYVPMLFITGLVAWIFRRVLFGMAVVETTVIADAPRSLVKLHAS